MKKIILIISSILFITNPIVFAQNGTFTLRSDNLGGQFSKEYLFDKFGCEGLNISPQLSWENAPDSTKSFAITMYDLDAPTGSGWWHWVVFDIPDSITILKKGAGNLKNNFLPEHVIQSITDFGTYGYGGPCPPKGSGTHRYITTVYALKIQKLGLTKDTNPATVGFYLNSNVLTKASLLVYFQR